MVDDGDQPFWDWRHVGITGGGTNEIIAYGLGRKLRDGSVVATYIMPNNMLCNSKEDAERIGVLMVRALGPRMS
jgi:hypothetical protein